MKYAENTGVSSEKSQSEIKQTLQRYGAKKYAYYEDDERAGISCEIQSRRIKFIVPLPSRTADKFVYTQSNQHASSRRVRDIKQQHDLWEKACRQRWRALALVVKAKLEAVESGIATFEQEFLNYIMLPDGQTVGEYIIPQIEQVYLSGRMPKMLPDIGETGKIN
jgi:hypothetical protein